MSNDDTENANPFNRWWIVSALFVVAVVVAVVLVIVLGRGGQDDAAPPSTNPTSSQGQAEPSAGASSPPGGKCTVNTANQDIPTAGPKAEWASDRYFLYPTSTEYGPVPANDLWGCFSPSPTGALFAAANAVAGIARENYADVVKANAVDNGGGDRYLATTQGQTREQIAGRVAQIRGFTFKAVEPQKVTVEMVLGQDDVQGSFTVALVWDENRLTWLVDYGASNFTPTAYSGALFTPWSANA